MTPAASLAVRSTGAFRLKVETLATWFWFLAATKAFLIYLFFQNAPLLGTAVGGIMSLGFGILLVVACIGCRLTLYPAHRPLPLKLIVVFLGWMAVTILWTHADSRVTSLGYWLLSISDLVIMGMLLQFGNIERVALASLRGIAWGGVAFAFVALLMSAGTGDNRLGNEDFLHPNTIGNQMAIASLCAIFLALESRARRQARIVWIVLSVVFTLTLLNSLSKTSIAGFALAASVYLLRSNMSLRKKGTLLTLILGAFGLCFGVLSKYMSQYLFETQGGEALSTFSGRTFIWANTWEMIHANPLLGYGFLSFRDFGPQFIDGLRLVHAHNEILTLWFCYGAIGVLLAGAVYLSFYWYVRREGRRKPQGALALALLVYSLVRSLTEATTLGLVFPLPLMMLLIVWLSEPRHAQG